MSLSISDNNKINNIKDNVTEIINSMDSDKKATNILKDTFNLTENNVKNLRESIEQNDSLDDEKPTNVLENRFKITSDTVTSIRNSLETVVDEEEKPTNVLEQKLKVETGAVRKIKNIWQEMINNDNNENKQLWRKTSERINNKKKFQEKLNN